MISTEMNSPFAPWLEHGSALLLDGGLGTELERRGHTQLGKLWSSALVRTNAMAIREVHRDYLDAGATCITAATFQAAMPVLKSVGLHQAEAEDLLRDAVALAARERDRYHYRHPERLRPIVAASIGPYGASLCNGGEYTGDYHLTPDEFHSFHAERWAVLCDSEADVIALETIPSWPEARALLLLLAATPSRQAWISFTCRDARHLTDGTPFKEVLKVANEIPNLCAVGVNCVAPRLALCLTEQLSHLTAKPLIIYPNASNAWDLNSRQPQDETLPDAFACAAYQWRRAGASILGGCCRTTPRHIAAMKSAIEG
ncbi:MAG: ybgG [Verrucomicrobiaceae bacterium]|nr:ybgG [Verrucomicrobiaceae bacterium]MDB6116956.1 ybgG [Verrucomicrobiaceae bacterium]